MTENKIIDFSSIPDSAGFSQFGSSIVSFIVPSLFRKNQLSKNGNAISADSTSVPPKAMAI